MAKDFVSGTLRSLFPALDPRSGTVFCFFFQFFEGGMVGRFGVFQILTPPKNVFFFLVTPLSNGISLAKPEVLPFELNLAYRYSKKCP